MITPLYAGILGILFFLISVETIKARKRNQVSLGVGSNNEIENMVGAHSNFSAYTPMFLMLLFFTEGMNTLPVIVTHGLGVLFCTGRLLHFIAFRGRAMNFKLRKVSMHLTLWPLFFVSMVSIYTYAKATWI